jgi:exodeoxyribonuclease VII large subunit
MSPPPFQQGLFVPPQAVLKPNAEKIYSVSELTREIKSQMEGRFSRLTVRGEISNHKPASSGHIYFTLKDDGACIAAVVFRADASRLPFKLQDGLSVIASGRIALYEPRGQYQIICDSLQPEGAGALALAFEQLKAKLAKEGLFEASRKKPIPFLASRIGVVTSPSGAALRDFLRVLQDRFPIPVLIAPTRVQGEGAAAEIAQAIQRLAKQNVDVIVITRGGGSIEDLWSFNEEIVARAIAASPVPVVSAVGHEVDFTIADFVADKRCATPTDAAKTLAPVRQELQDLLEKQKKHLHHVILRWVSVRRERLQMRSLRVTDPRRRIGQERLALDHALERCRRSLHRQTSGQRAGLGQAIARLMREHPQNKLGRWVKLLENSRERIEKGVIRTLSQRRLRLTTAAARLESLSPLGVLSRGYSVVFSEEGKVLTSATQAPRGATISLLLSDRSKLTARVLASQSEALENSTKEKA